jgi:hypothetical protein
LSTKKFKAEVGQVFLEKGLIINAKYKVLSRDSKKDMNPTQNPACGRQGTWYIVLGT